MSRIKEHNLTRIQKMTVPGTCKQGYRIGRDIYATSMSDARVWVWDANTQTNEIGWERADKKTAEGIRRYARLAEKLAV